MSITVTYYRLPAAQRENVTCDENSWQQFQRGIQKAHHQALLSAIADMDKGGGSKQERFARLASLRKERSDPRQFNMEKEWHTIAYLLTGEPEIGAEHRDGEPLHNIIYGGLDTGVTTGYGTVQYFDSALVTESADALEQADRQRIHERFDPARMAQLEIYAAPSESERDLVLRVIEELAAFFRAAAAGKEDVIRFAS
jgi:hypothetical protein